VRILKKMVVTPLAISCMNDGVYTLSDRIRKKVFNNYDDVCILCEERWKQFAVWDSNIKKPRWTKSEKSEVRLENMYRLGMALDQLNNPKREDDYIYSSIFQSDSESISKGLKFLHSVKYLKAWESFYEKITVFGSYEKIFLSVTQLYEEYIHFCTEVLQKKPFMKSIQMISGSYEYSDFGPLLNAAVWCIRYEIDPAVYVKVMYDAFMVFQEQKQGDAGGLYFSTKHIGSTSQVRPSVKKFKMHDEKVHPWKEIIQFLGLNENIKIECKRGIPLGFNLAKNHEASGGSLKDIILIHDSSYWAKGINYEACFQFNDNSAFALYVTPENFHEFKDKWYNDDPPIPDYEVLRKNGSNITRERYNAIRKLIRR